MASDNRTGRGRVPHELKLLPGLKWRGKLRIVAREPDGRYVVGFDAEDPKADPQERYVYDRTVLTAQQLKAWTGWEEAAGKRGGNGD